MTTPLPFRASRGDGEGSDPTIQGPGGAAPGPPADRPRILPPAQGATVSTDHHHDHDTKASEYQLATVPADVPLENGRDSFIVWRVKVQGLTPQQRTQFLAHRRADLAAYLADFDAIAQRHGQRRGHRIAAAIAPLWELTKVLAPIASDPWLSQIDPSHSSLILGGISHLLSFSGRFLDFYDRVVDVLADMLERLPIIEKIELVHAAHPDPDLRDAAINICADVLQYCVEASDLFVDEKGRERSSARLLFTSARSSFDDKFGDLKSQFDRHVQLFDTYAQLAMSRKHVQFMRDREIRDVIEDERALRRDQRDHQSDLAKSIKTQEAKRQALLDRIPSFALQRVQDDRLERCLEGTGNWLLNHANFQSWVRSTSSELLWVHGKHGCGKSHLAAMTIDHLARTVVHNGIPALAYMYCNSVDASQTVHASGTSNEESASIDLDRLIGTILKQLLRHLPVSKQLPSLDDNPSLSGDGRPTRQQMKTAILDVLAKLQNAFVIIDGLDECHQLGNPQFSSLCDFFGSLSSSGTQIKTLVFSRPNYAEIDKAFAGAASIQVDGGANSEAIELFVGSKMSGIRVSESILQEIAGKLVSRADGMFLWVDLISGSLKNERNVRGIRRAIENLPEGLDTVYEWSMERIFRQSRVVRERALNILLWITNARRPLTREELLEALAVELDMTDLDEETRLQTDDDFTTECADLIILRNNCYHLLHLSLKEYLQSTSTLASASPALKCYAELQRHADESLADTCLTYLNFNACQSGPFETPQGYNQFLKENPFFCYASLNWGQHLDSTRDQRLRRLAVTVLSSDATRNTCLQHMFKTSTAYTLSASAVSRPFPFAGGTTAMHALAMLGQTRVAEANAQFWPSIYEEDCYGNLPFRYAIATGSNSMCDFILDVDTKLRRQTPGPTRRCWSRDALHYAAAWDWSTLITRMMDRGLDQNAVLRRWGPPLYVAVKSGSRNAVAALLAAGADPNITDGRRTPLVLAIQQGRNDIVALLIEKGADVKLRFRHGNHTALHNAARDGNIEAARLLLRHGSDVNAADDNSETPVFYAAYRGRVELVKMLIREHHAARTIDGAHLLEYATESGSVELVSFLLDLGFKPRTTGRNRQQTILHAATHGGCVELLKMLLGRFPDLDLRAKDGEGQTPLHLAAHRGFLNTVQYLLETDPSLATIRSSTGTLPLHIAVRHASGGQKDWAGRPADFVGCVKLLSTAETINSGGFEGRTPLMEAVYWAQLPILELLIQHGADVNKADLTGRTPLLEAASMWKTTAFDYFVQLGADVTKTDNDNCGVLGYLILHHHFCIAESLIRRGVDVDPVPGRGKSPLFLAVHSNCTRLTDRLLNHGADQNRRWKHRGETLFLHAVARQCIATVELLESRDIVDYHAVDNDGISAVHHAIRLNNLPLLQRFLKGRRMLAFETDFTGMDSLSFAASEGFGDAIPPLLAMGFPPDGLGRHCIGLTPLGHAAIFANLGAIRLLIKAGANVNHVSSAPWHRNAGHWAASSGFPRITEALLRAGLDFGARDALGCSVADYVRQHRGAAWRRVQRWCTQPTTTLSPERPNLDLRGVLHKTVLDCVTALLALDCAPIDDRTWQESNEPRPARAAFTESLRRQHLVCLAQALSSACLPHQNSRLSTAPWMASTPVHDQRRDALADASLCLQEILRNTTTRWDSIQWTQCTVCCARFRNPRTPRSHQATFKCISCSWMFICPRCHSRYVKHGPSVLVERHCAAVSSVELSLEPFAVAVEPLRLNMKLLVEAVSCKPQVEDWIRSFDFMFEDSFRWDDERHLPCNVTSRWRKLASIISRALSLRRLSLDPKPMRHPGAVDIRWRALLTKKGAEEERWLALGVDLADVYSRIPHVETIRLRGEQISRDWCEGHDFIEIPLFKDLPEEQQDLFGSTERLKDEFFQDLLKRWSRKEDDANPQLAPEPETTACQDPTPDPPRFTPDNDKNIAEDGDNHTQEDQDKVGESEPWDWSDDDDDDDDEEEENGEGGGDEAEQSRDGIPSACDAHLVGGYLLDLIKSEDPRAQAFKTRKLIQKVARRVGHWPRMQRAED